MYIKRDLYEELLLWKAKKNRKPLLLQGARQVGKTSLLKNFGKNEFEDIAYFNFEEQPELNQLFEITKNPKRIIENLSIVNGRAILPDNKTLIIFDEIQESNSALNSLKYFNEKSPEFFIIASGSLLGVSLSQNQSFPVGQVEFMNLYPITFKEFLSVFEPTLYSYLLNYPGISAIPDIFFNQLAELLRLYFITGGMPEAIKNYYINKNISELLNIQNSILNAYKLDFSKHIKSSDIPKINYVWSSLPSQLSRENKKFLYQTIKKGARAREYENALIWLKEAGLIHVVNRINKPGFPISAYKDLSAFKVYLLDVGLLVRMAKLHPLIIQDRDIVFSEFKGALAENFILQSLLPKFDSEIYYWTSNNQAEVDFILSYEDFVIPIEVKSKTNIRSKSLSVYSNKYKPEIKIRYSLKNLSLNDNLLNIPLFMVDFTKELLRTIKQ